VDKSSVEISLTEHILAINQQGWSRVLAVRVPVPVLSASMSESESESGNGTQCESESDRSESESVYPESSVLVVKFSFWDINCVR